jgi:RNA polymerase sigma-70 factor (ECF subfamily)
MNAKTPSFIEQIYRDNHEGFLRFLMYKCGSRDEAEDVLQEAFQKIIKKDDLNEMENPRAYLYKAAQNIIIDRYRKNKHKAKYISEEAAGVDRSEPLSSSTIPPERQMAAKQDLDEIYHKLNELPVNCKDAFLMHREHHMKYSEIADKLGVSVSMIEKYIIRALKYLRKNNYD